MAQYEAKYVETNGRLPGKSMREQTELFLSEIAGHGLEAQEVADSALELSQMALTKAESALLAASSAESKVDLVAEMRNMHADATTLPAGEDATASYDSATNVMRFGIPKGDQGEKGDPGDPPDFKGEVTTPEYLPPTGNPGDGWFTIDGDLYYWGPLATAWKKVTNLRGPVGPAIAIKGTKDSEGELPPTGDGSEGWLVNGDLWIWSESDERWVNVGKIQGPAGVPEIALIGLFATSASRLPAGRAGDFGYVEGLGVYKFYPDDSETPVDGEWCIAPQNGSGRWIMVLPSVDTVFALSQRITDTMPLTVTKEVTWTAIAAQGSQSRSITIPGAVVGSPCFATGPRLVGGLVLTASVTADETVTLRLDNYSSAAITPASGMYTIKIFNS